jgi:hypothetical protein
MTHLARELQSSIDTWADQLWRESRLAQLTRSGALSERALALYLESLRFLFHHSQRNLAAASTRARTVGNERLANIFGAKASEETGHDQWASRDLSGLTRSAVSGVEPAAGSRRLVELQRELIMDHHPLCFFAYSLWAEYMTVRLGDAWLNALASNGYARTSVTAVANHVDADREHAAEGFAVLDQLWDGQPERALILRSVERAQTLFEAFCDEVYLAAVSVEQRVASTHSGKPGQNKLGR